MADSDPEENATEQQGETEADESGEDSSSVLIPTSMFPDAKPGDTVTMTIGQIFGEEMEAMPVTKKASAAKPAMPMRPSIEDDMRAEMANPTP